MNVSAAHLANKLLVPEQIFLDSMNVLDNMGIISFSQTISKETVILITQRVEAEKRNLNYKLINESYLNSQRKLDKILEFVFTNECRFKNILNYFGENVPDYKCNKCDNCTSTGKLNDTSAEYLSEKIIETLEEANEEIPENFLINLLRGEKVKESAAIFWHFGVAAALGKPHEQHPLRSNLDWPQLAAAFPYLDDAVLAAVLNNLRQAGRVQIAGDSVALSGHGPKLSQNERKLLDELIPIFRQAGIQSPSVDECQQRATKRQQSVPQLLALAAANGDLVEIAAGYYLHRDVDRQLQDQLRRQLGSGGATLSEIRELLATTRKYAVPYCEYLVSHHPAWRVKIYQ